MGSSVGRTWSLAVTLTLGDRSSTWWSWPGRWRPPPACTASTSSRGRSPARTSTGPTASPSR
uniref:ATSPS4F n=1 Tax=Arundo donax TaxID=35708 RepID=A0A0A9AKY0_ARUDO